MRAVNLLPKDVQRAAAQKPYGPIIIGSLAVLVCMGVLFKMRSSADQQIADKKTEIAAITHKPAKKPPNVTDGQRAAAAQEGPRITALDSALQTRIPWDNVLRQVSLVVPDDVHLLSLNLAAPVEADAIRVAAKTDAGVQLKGYSYSQDGVARFLARLQVVPALTNVKLASSVFGATSTTTTEGSSTASGIVSFEISADIVAPAVIS
jgi:Tfp pilus assembly protein PilN